MKAYNIEYKTENDEIKDFKIILVGTKRKNGYFEPSCKSANVVLVYTYQELLKKTKPPFLTKYSNKIAELIKKEIDEGRLQED